MGATVFSLGVVRIVWYCLSGFSVLSKHVAYYSNKYLLCWHILVCSLYTSLEHFVMPSLKLNKVINKNRGGIMREREERIMWLPIVYVPCKQWHTQEFFWGGWGCQQMQLRTERTEIWGAVAPLVRGSGGSCNLVQEISFHIVKFY